MANAMAIEPEDKQVVLKEINRRGECEADDIISVIFDNRDDELYSIYECRYTEILLLQLCSEGLLESSLFESFDEQKEYYKITEKGKKEVEKCTTLHKNLSSYCE